MPTYTVELRIHGNRKRVSVEAETQNRALFAAMDQYPEASNCFVVNGVALERAEREASHEG